MPNFTAYNVDVDLDIDIDDFLSECSSRDIDDLVNTLVQDGHLSPKQVVKMSSKGLSVLEEEFNSKCIGLASKFHSMDSNEIEIIENLYKKYC